jgi:hypothetical protein
MLVGLVQGLVVEVPEQFGLVLVAVVVELRMLECVWVVESL